MDRLTEMSAFVRSVEAGSFVGAARELDMSPQWVGKRVAGLEKRLGAQLLVRTTRHQSLTEIGRAFYERCRLVLREAEDAEAFVAESGRMARGRVRVSAPKTFGTVRLIPVLHELLEQHPGIRVDLVLTDRPVDVVGEGFDLVVRIGELKESSLVARRLRSLRLVACASRAYLARRGHPMIPSELVTHECLIYDYWGKPPLTRWKFTRNGRSETVTVAGRLQLNDGTAAIEAALAGRGIVLQDREVLKRHIDDGGLVRLFPHHDGPERPLHIVMPPTRAVTPKLRSLIAALVRAFGDSR